MKDVRFICNFCREPRATADLVVGLYWMGGKESLEQRDPNQVENHLCKVCWKALGKLLVVDNSKAGEPK